MGTNFFLWPCGEHPLLTLGTWLKNQLDFILCWPARSVALSANQMSGLQFWCHLHIAVSYLFSFYVIEKPKLLSSGKKKKKKMQMFYSNQSINLGEILSLITKSKWKDHPSSLTVKLLSSFCFSKSKENRINVISGGALQMWGVAAHFLLQWNEFHLTFLAQLIWHVSSTH